MTDTLPPRNHNRPPTPFDEAVTATDLLWTEAAHWLSGDSATTQAEADAIAVLLDMARKARKQVDHARRDEAKPLDEAKAEIQARYKPLLGKCDAVADAAKKALAPYLDKQERAKREAEAKARAEAKEAETAALLAFAAAKSIEDRQRAEEAAERARQATIAARVAAKDRGHAKGGARAVTLRTNVRPRITDLAALMKWIWANDRSAFQGFAEQYVAGAYRAGQFEMNGVEPIEERVAV